MAGVSERYAVPHDRRAAQEARSLHGLLSKAIADCVDRMLQTRATWLGFVGEQFQLSRVPVAESCQSDAKGSNGAARVACREQLQRGLVDLLTCGDRTGQL